MMMIPRNSFRVVHRAALLAQTTRPEARSSSGRLVVRHHIGRIWATTGRNFSSDSGDDAQMKQTVEQQTSIYQEEMEDMKAEREALFGFTDEEQSAWSKAGNGNN